MDLESTASVVGAVLAVLAVLALVVGACLGLAVGARAARRPWLWLLAAYVAANVGWALVRGMVR